MGLILSQNGWRGGLDIRLLSSVRAGTCLYGDASGDGGPVRGFHLLPSVPNSISYNSYVTQVTHNLHSTRAVSQYLVAFSLKPLCHQAVKLTVSCSPETAFEWSDIDRCSQVKNSGWFWAPQWQNRSEILQSSQLGIADTLQTRWVWQDLEKQHQPGLVCSSEWWVSALHAWGESEDTGLGAYMLTCTEWQHHTGM